mgnify:CR=1 FL=1|tara:strand:- start:2577 stop:3620 length:1044 start_codon:yes stop_codon:yes gene_type:complete
MRVKVVVMISSLQYMAMINFISKQITFLMALGLLSSSVHATETHIEVSAETSAEEYINTWKVEALRQMKLFSIPASITLAQGMLESGNGVSELVKKSNNHFGIKCHADWKGGRTYHDDDEKGECFRVYEDPKDSYEDHSKFLLRTRYTELFELDIYDYKGWAKGLKKCGYATNPKYADLLITLIERHGLDKLDREGADAIADYIPDKEEREISGKGAGTKHSIRTTENGIQYILAVEGDKIKALAKELEMMPWQFRRYNDIGKNFQFRKGDKIYLQPKKNSASVNWHTVSKGETLWSISQHYGVKMKALAKKNNIKVSANLLTAMKLSMKYKLTKEGKLPWHAKFGN